MAKKQATYGNYTVIVNDDNSITVKDNGNVCDNSKAALRDIAALVGFEVNPDWNTRQFGAKLVDAINKGVDVKSNNATVETDTKAEVEAKVKAEEARLKAEAEAKAKAEEEARLKAEAEAKSKAGEEARLKAEAEAKAKAEEEAKGNKVKATDETIRKIVYDAIERLGNNADLNFIDVSEVTNMSFLLSGFNRTNETNEFNGDISKWDVSNVTNMTMMFYNSSFNGDISKWDVSKVTNMKEMFEYSAFNGDISKWDVSNVTDMEEMFHRSNFNGDISKWNVSNVTKMSGMFMDGKFNGDISKWNVSNVTNMAMMFWESSFNGDISKWDVSKVYNMMGMFYKSQFNGDISNWNVSNVEYMHKMFYCSTFNGDISKWDVSNVYDMKEMFMGSQFNGDVSKWNVSKVQCMSYMFAVTSFNGDVSNWDVSNVTNMKSMFESTPFNGDVSSWDVSNVENMESMFADSQFNGDVSNWDVSNVKNMNGMFSKCPFNGDVSKWNVSKVTDMGFMFDNSQFNGDVSNWDVSKVTNMRAMFQSAPFKGDVSQWNVSNVTDMGFMFLCTPFNGDVSQWNVAKVTDMKRMFAYSSFGRNISKWNVTNVTDHDEFDKESKLTPRRIPSAFVTTPINTYTFEKQYRVLTSIMATQDGKSSDDEVLTYLGMISEIAKKREFNIDEFNKANDDINKAVDDKSKIDLKDIIDSVVDVEDQKILYSCCAEIATVDKNITEKEQIFLNILARMWNLDEEYCKSVVSQWIPVKKEYTLAYQYWFLTSAIAGSDGEFSENEKKAIYDLPEEIALADLEIARTQTRIDTVSEVVESVTNKSHQKLLYSACVRVASVDQVVQQDEQKFLSLLAKSWGFDKSYCKYILNQYIPQNAGRDKLLNIFSALSENDVYTSGFSTDKNTIKRIFETTSSNKEGVLARLTIIDSMYSTQMGKRYYGLDELSETICKIDNLEDCAKRFVQNPDALIFDDNIKRDGLLGGLKRFAKSLISGEDSELSLFNEKYGINKNGKEAGVAISLISKYLYFLTDYKFPIYDSIALEMYPKIWEYCGFESNEMPRYKTSLRNTDENYGNDAIECFVKAINVLLNKLGVDNNPKKYDILDRIMWFTGKICRGNLSLIISQEEYTALANEHKAKTGSDKFEFNIEKANLSEMEFLKNNEILMDFFRLAKVFGQIK